MLGRIKNTGLSSFFSLLSGTRTRADNDYQATMALWEELQDHHNIYYYHRDIETNTGVQTVPWVKTSHGVYTLITRPRAQKIKGVYHDVPATALIYASDPDVLCNTIKAGTGSAGSYEIVAYYDDIDLVNYGHISYAEFIAALGNHNKDKLSRIENHAVFKKESDTLYRSDSTVIAALPSKIAGHYDIRIYFHPLADRGLSIRPDLLNSSAFRLFFKSISFATSHINIHANQLATAMQDTANACANDITRYRRPLVRYDHTKSKLKKIGEVGKKATLAAAQPISHLFARIDKGWMVFGIVTAGLFQMASVVAVAMMGIIKQHGVAFLGKIGLFSAIAGGNLLQRTASGAGSFLSKVIKRPKYNNDSRIRNYAQNFTSLMLNEQLIDHDITAYPAASHFLNGLSTPLPFANIEPFTRQFQPFSSSVNNQWKMRRECYPDMFLGASIVTSHHHNGETFLKSLEGNGKTTYYHRDCALVIADDQKPQLVTANKKTRTCKQKVMRSTQFGFDALVKHAPKLSKVNDTNLVPRPSHHKSLLALPHKKHAKETTRIKRHVIGLEYATLRKKFQTLAHQQTTMEKRKQLEQKLNTTLKSARNHRPF